jgi:hypothetical protein
MKTAWVLLTITLALAASASAQTATDTHTTIINRCITIGNATLPFLKANAKIADDHRNAIADRQSSLQIIMDVSALMQDICGAKTLPDSTRAVRAINTWIQQQKPRFNALPTVKAGK